MKRALLSVSALVLAAVAAYEGYQLGLWRFQYPEYPVRGIDVSHHQSEIDWRAVRAAGIRFAYLKATEGGDFTDPRFERNWRDAGDAGIARGAYHFFSLCRTAETQAANFLSSVPSDPNALPPALDLEFGGNCASRPAPPVLCDNLKHYLKIVEERFGKRVVFYATRDFLESYPCVPDRPLWGRSLLRAPDRRWKLWQFASRARVPGIKGPVDLDVFVGDAAGWDALLQNLNVSPKRP